MMNLEKMKQKKRTITKSRVKKSLLAATTFLCLTTPLLQTQTAYAAENTTPAITIEKPDGWKQGETTIAVTVDASHMPEGFSIAKIEAKAGKMVFKYKKCVSLAGDTHLLFYYETYSS